MVGQNGHFPASLPREFRKNLRYEGQARGPRIGTRNLLHGMNKKSNAYPACRAPRIMFYSHDTFGLGHLRRSRALASAITASDSQASALILTGSPVAGRFTFPRRVDHVRLPGVTKLADGSYVSQTIGMGIDDVTELRSSLIRTAVKQYQPDVLVVDKDRKVVGKAGE